MSIQIGSINVPDAIINTEFRVSVLERVVDKLIRAAPVGAISENDMQAIRREVVELMQKKYPDAGISLQKK